MAEAEILLSIALGVGLAAAAGLRVFVPLLVLSVASYGGYVDLDPSLAWMGTLPALLMLAVAALIEVLSYYIPGVDNLLDVLATPAALIAGTLVTAAVITDLPPLVKWTTAVIAGGGAAGLTQGVTSLLRAKSTATTGGLGNSAVASGELGGSLVLAVLAILAPIVAVVLVLLLCWVCFKLLRRLWSAAGRPTPQN